jgi:integrase
VHIRDAKGNKDRLVPLPENTLRILRDFWSVHKHPVFIFPNRKRGLKNAHLVDSPLERGGIQTAMKAVVQHIGIKKKFHAIRYVTVMQRICWRLELILLNCKRSLAMSVC